LNLHKYCSSFISQFNSHCGVAYV